MRTYRWGSGVFGALYIALAVSIDVRPPQPQPGDVTLFDHLPAGLWTVGFVLAALILLITAAARPAHLFVGHFTAFVVAAPFSVGNLDVSIENSTGWLLATAFAAIATAHLLLIRLRPVEAR